MVAKEDVHPRRELCFTMFFENWRTYRMQWQETHLHLTGSHHLHTPGITYNQQSRVTYTTTQVFGFATHRKYWSWCCCCCCCWWWWWWWFHNGNVSDANRAVVSNANLVAASDTASCFAENGKQSPTDWLRPLRRDSPPNSNRQNNKEKICSRTLDCWIW